MYIKVNKKITLEQFINIKEKIAQLLTQFQDYLDDRENDKDFNFDLSEKKFIEQAFLIESNLFNCDLSDYTGKAIDVENRFVSQLNINKNGIEMHPFNQDALYILWKGE